MILQQLELRVVVTSAGVTASFDPVALLAQADVTSDSAGRIELIIATGSISHGHEPRLRLDPPTGVTTPRDEHLVELILRSFAVRDQLLAMTADDIAAMRSTALRHLERVARLSYLAPDIVTAILDGTQPRKLSARTLSRMAALPLSWTAQRRVLGLLHA